MDNIGKDIRSLRPAYPACYENGAAMDLIEQELGKKMSAKEVATRLGIDIKTVRLYYSDLGGIRIGERRLVFFERKLLHGLSKLQQKQGQVPLDGTGDHPGQEKAKVLQNQEVSRPVGGGSQKRRRPRSTGDPHNIFG